MPEVAKTNREFLRLAVIYLMSQGVRQFLDLGSGLPTVGGVHEVAQAIDPQARVVYVDIDATAVLHSRLILIGDPNCTVLQSNYSQPELVLNAMWDSSDFSKPIAVLALGVIHFIPDTDEAVAVTEAIYDNLAAGSHFVISHAARDQKQEEAHHVEAMYARSGNSMVFRHPRTDHRDLRQVCSHTSHPGPRSQLATRSGRWSPTTATPESVSRNPNHTSAVRLGPEPPQRRSGATIATPSSASTGLIARAAQGPAVRLRTDTLTICRPADSKLATCIYWP